VLCRSLPSARRVPLSRLDRVIHKYERVIFWGNCGPVTYSDKILNIDTHLATAKREFFVRTGDAQDRPPYWLDKEGAAAWLTEKEGRIVFARTKLTGHSGEGVVVCRAPDDLPDAKLYTAYIRKKAEYRIHVNTWSDNFFVQQKRKRNGASEEDYSALIRSYRHGWVYCSDNVDPVTTDMVHMAQRAVRNCGLDFGAVDLIVSKKDRPYVLEVNTAPALSAPSTKEFYVGQFNLL